MTKQPLTLQECEEDEMDSGKDTDDRVWVILLRRALGHNYQWCAAKRGSKINNAGQWNFIGGHVDPGEDLLTAAVREAHEETRINLSRSDLVPLYSEQGPKAKSHWFVVLYDPLRHGRLQLTEESEEYDWFYVEDTLPIHKNSCHKSIRLLPMRVLMDFTKRNP